MLPLPTSDSLRGATGRGLSIVFYEPRVCVSFNVVSSYSYLHVHGAVTVRLIGSTMAADLYPVVVNKFGVLPSEASTPSARHERKV